MKFNWVFLFLFGVSFLGCIKKEDRGIIVTEIAIPFNYYSTYKKQYVLNSFDDYKNYHFHIDSVGVVYDNGLFDENTIDYSIIDTSMSNMPYIDFSRFTAIGKYIVADRYSKFELKVRDTGTAYHYKISYKLMRSTPSINFKWVLVPKLPEGYKVFIDDIEYEF